MQSDKFFVSSLGKNWIIVNERNFRVKKIGPISRTGSGRNFFDEAKILASQRMNCDPVEVEYKPCFFESKEYINSVKKKGERI